jgi:segregation and condensation protein B
MMRVEAVIFAASQPVTRETLAPLVGTDCHLDRLIADIRDELRARPYELVEVAGAFQYRTRQNYAQVIRAAGVVAATGVELTKLETLVLTVVGYFQPVTRASIAEILGRPISRDVIAVLRNAQLIATGPRSPQPGAPYTYVTTPTFLTVFGLATCATFPTWTGSKRPASSARRRCRSNCATCLACAMPKTKRQKSEPTRHTLSRSRNKLVWDNRLLPGAARGLPRPPRRPE